METVKISEHSFPPGRIKITQALKSLLAQKDFQTIKIAEIAETAGVNEALIYKYFKNKRDLLYQMIVDHLEYCQKEMIEEINRQKGAFLKLETFICTFFDLYNKDRIFAKIMLFELRNSSDFYLSTPYRIIQSIYDLCLSLIKEGISDGTFRKDMNVSFIRQHIIGSVEQFCMNSIISDRDIQSKEMTGYLIDLLTNGITRKTDFH